MLHKIRLEEVLLEPEADGICSAESYSAALDARGVYTPTQFAVRLKPEIHRLINAVSTGIHPKSNLDNDTIQAFSTYLHETVHWWQHMGSTSGLIQSLVYPAQAHQNQGYLEEVLRLVGHKKPLKKWAEDAARSGMSNENPALIAANIAVNNAVDLEFYKFISATPEKMEEVYKSPYFESVGHCYSMAYGHVVGLLTATVDREIAYLPDPRKWEGQFQILRDDKAEGFEWNGQVDVPALGLKALFEGQARFIQMQYLTSCVLEPPSFEELRADGYFDGVYGEAFFAFIKILQADHPKKIEDPLVGLFLLILDLAINPSAGFPYEIECFEDFIVDVDPGWRFLFLCRAAKSRPELLSAVQEYSRDEYVQVSCELAAACGYADPITILSKVSSWQTECPGVKIIMAEKSSFLFQPANIVTRVIFSHFIEFCNDKLEHPEFFCWPGVWMAGSRVSTLSQKLFLNHLSLYTNREDKEGIFPREIPGKDPKGLDDTLNTFYRNLVIYDLTKQWTLTPGSFEYNYEWLLGSSSYDQVEDWAKALFEQVYGISPDAFEQA